MAPRSGIIAGKTVIVVQVQESIDKALATISTKLNKFSNNIGRLGLELFGGGVFTGILAKQITDTFKSFEDAILFLRTKLDATEAEFAVLENRIRSLGRSTSFTAKEVAEAATILAQGGLNARETTDTLQATLDLARAGQVTLTQAGDILINTMRSFSIETTRAEEVASQFIAAARLGTLDILNLKESIKEVLGTVRILNIDLPTTLALLTQMAERSLKGTKAGTSLNTALLNLASKADVLKKNLGITLPKNLDGESFLIFLDQLYTKINQLGNRQQVTILQRLFNIRGGRAITALDDLKKIINLQKQIRLAGNESRKAAILMDSGFGGAVRRATSAVESLGITIGKLFADGFTPILQTVPALSASLEKLANANQSLIIPLGLLPPTLLGVGAGLLTFSFIGSKVAGVIGVVSGVFHKFSNVVIGGLNGQLVLLNQTMSLFFKKVKREGKGSSLSKKGGVFQRFDEGLSSQFLAPQKVKKGASAGKIRPTSFFERVGKAEITTLGILRKVSVITIGLLEKGVLKLSRVFGVLKTAAMSLDRTFGLFVTRIRSVITNSNKFGEMYKSLSSRINTAARNISNLKTAHVSLNKEIAASTARLAKYQAEADFFTKQATAGASANKRANILSAELKSLDNQIKRKSIIQNRLIVVDEEFEKELNKKTRNRKERRSRVSTLAALGTERKRLQDELAATKSADELRRRRINTRNELDLQQTVDVDSLKKKAAINVALADQERANLDVQKKKRVGFGVSLKQQKQDLSLGLKQRAVLKEAGSRRRAIGITGFLQKIPKGANSLFSGLQKGLSSIFKGAGKALLTGLKTLPKLLDNTIVGLFKFFKASGGFLVGILRIANGIRKFVFSISGVLTIIDLLILFGPKIGFIRDAFSRLGEGFSNAFATISGTAKDLAPVFALFKAGLANIFGGEGELGIRGLIEGFGLLADIVKSNLKIAFLQVVEAVAPLYDFLRRITLSLIEVAKLVGSIFGATLGNIGGAINGLTGGGAGGFLGNLTEIFQSAFSPENIKAAFAFIGNVLIEMARIVNKTIQDMFIVVNNLASFVQNAITKLFELIYRSLIKVAEALPQQLSGIKNGLFGAAGVGEMIANAMRPELDANIKAGNAITNSFDTTNKKLDSLLSNFLTGLSNIFSVDTEANAKNGIAAAKAAKEAAQAEAEKQTKIQEQANTPFGKVGQFLAGVPLLPGKLLSSVLGPKQQKSFDPLLFGKTVLDAGKNFAATADPVTLKRFEEKRLKDERKGLNQRLAEINRIEPFERLLDLPGKVKELDTVRQETVKKLKDNATALAALGPGTKGRTAITPGSLKDIVSATVGTFQQTRGNLLKIAGAKNVDQMQLDALKQVVDNTGGPGDNVFSQLQDLNKRAQPFVFQ